MTEKFLELLSEYIEYVESKWPALGEPSLMGLYKWLKEKKENE